jgi:hypothetical protein
MNRRCHSIDLKTKCEDSHNIAPSEAWELAPRKESAGSLRGFNCRRCLSGFSRPTVRSKSELKLDVLADRASAGELRP